MKILLGVSGDCTAGPGTIVHTKLCGTVTAAIGNNVPFNIQSDAMVHQTSVCGEFNPGPRDYLDTSAFDVFCKSVPIRKLKRW